MLSEELESRMSKIIERLDKLEIKEKNPLEKNDPSETEKYENFIKKNAKKRMSQVSEKITDFMNPEKEDETENNTNNDSSQENTSIALNMKKPITIGEFQVELEKLLEILEESFNNKDKKYLEKYAKYISFSTDDDTLTMDDDSKIKKFGETLEKKYHKISLLLKRYIKENSIVDELLGKEKRNNGEMNIKIKGRKRRSLFDNIPFMGGKEYKPVKELPNFGNTFLFELKEDIQNKKRISCVNIGKTNKNIMKENSSDESEEEKEEENGEKVPVYRPGKLRSSFMFL